MKRILFPTDFSKNADHALAYARSLCLTLEAELVLFHSCRAEAMALQNTVEDVSEEAIMYDSVLRLKEYKETHFTGETINVTQKIAYGLAVDTILQTADSIKADMIVMGTKGSSGIDEILLGSNTAAVMERAKCPVLAVPETAEFHPINVLAFATDFRENDSTAIGYLSTIAALFNAKLIVVHLADVLVPDNFEHALFDVFKNEVLQKVSYKNIEFEVIKGFNSVKVLNEFVRERNISFVAVSTRKKNLFTRLFDKSFTKQLAYHSNVPVMAFHQGE